MITSLTPAMKRLLFSLTLATAFVAGPAAGHADCFSIIAGKAATADGSVLFAHHEDNAPKYAAGMVLVPHTNHSAGETVKLPSGTRIPQVPTTYGYWWLMMPELSYSDVLLNEYGVATASDACASHEDSPQITSGGIGDPVLRRLVVERARSAREGVQLVGALVEQYGYPDSGRTLLIADPQEGWMVCLVNGIHWVAERVPDNAVGCVPNTYSIGAVNLADTNNFLGSADLIPYAVQRGWYNPAAGPFSFEAAYADPTARSATGRQWTALTLLAAGPLPAPDSVRPPFAVAPKVLLAVSNLIAVLRDPGVSAGLANNSSSVFQLRAGTPAELKSVWWLAMGPGYTTPFVPLYLGMSEVPEQLAFGVGSGAFCEYCVVAPVFGPAYQLFRNLADWVEASHTARVGLAQFQWQALEQTSFDLQPAIEGQTAALWASQPATAREFLARYCGGTLTRAMQQADELMQAPPPGTSTNSPVPQPPATVTGQWDFNQGNLAATVGKDLQYFDGPTGTTASLTQFGTCSSFGLPLINGVDAKVMKVPGGPGVNGNNNFGFIMDHQIASNGGGIKVNQYTIIWDIYYTGGTIPFFNCENPTNNGPADGSLFLQLGQMGQGSGGYTMEHGDVSVGWHRLAFAVDLSRNLITKWVDGVKAQDWVSSSNGLDAARRAWQPTVLLFADGDGDDHDGTVYVSSIQVRNGTMTEAEMVLLGGPSGAKLPQAVSLTSVTGQWDFNQGNLAATIGKDLQYFDEPTGTTASLTQFGTCSSFGLPLINGVDAKVMKVPGGPGINGNNNFGYIMDHQIAPNGGGAKVNQYTIIWDIYYSGGTFPFFNCENPTNNAPADGSLFLQDGAMGQGPGGYTMEHGNISVGWHRLAFAVDLSQNLITKWVDGVKAQDWVSSSNGLDAARRAWQPTVLLFADGDGDDHDGTVYMKSIQVSRGKLSDPQMQALGSPSAAGVPLSVPRLSAVQSGRNLKLEWPSVFSGFVLSSTADLSTHSWTPVPGVDYVNNTVTLALGPGPKFLRLRSTQP